MPDALKDMVDNSEHINVSNLEHLKSLAVSAQAGSSKTLQGWIKNLVCKNPTFVQPSVLELLLVGVSVSCSEAIAETYGSVMETYHQDRFLNTGPTNDDIRLQKEMFIRINGPHLGRSNEFCRIISSRLKVGPTALYWSKCNPPVAGSRLAWY